MYHAKGGVEEVEKLYSIAETAEILGLQPARTRELCRQGRLPGAQKIGRDWIVPESGIKAYKPGAPGRPKASGIKDILRKAGILPPPDN